MTNYTKEQMARLRDKAKRALEITGDGLDTDSIIAYADALKAMDKTEVEELPSLPVHVLISKGPVLRDDVTLYCIPALYMGNYVLHVLCVSDDHKTLVDITDDVSFITEDGAPYVANMFYGDTDLYVQYRDADTYPMAIQAPTTLDCTSVRPKELAGIVADTIKSVHDVTDIFKHNNTATCFNIIHNNTISTIHNNGIETVLAEIFTADTVQYPIVIVPRDVKDGIAYVSGDVIEIQADKTTALHF